MHEFPPHKSPTPGRPARPPLSRRTTRPALTSPPVRRVAILTALLILADIPATAWIFPEHRDITALAITGLDAGRRAALDRLWVAARTGFESRLSPLVVESSDSAIDYASWPAIAGDHSCSPAELLDDVLGSGWILDVNAIGARLKTDLAEAGIVQHDRLNAVRRSDLDLLRADPGYATRAGANNIHFLLSRPSPSTRIGDYIESCVGAGAEPNAIGAYTWYHGRALQKARRLAVATPGAGERDSLARSLIADEAFAIHFLQDAFAAGHVAGIRGSASLRKGTHDYYNEHGLEVHTWDDVQLVLKGDAWMRGQDAERAALVVRASLQQILDVTEGGGDPADFPAGVPGLSAAETMNTCSVGMMPGGRPDSVMLSLLTPILGATPMPGLSEGEGELPRFRSELGPFIGISTAGRAGISHGGFSSSQTTAGGVGGLDIGVRFGLGLEGVLNESGDGLAFLDVGFRQDAASSIAIYDDQGLEEFGQIFSAIPSRTAFTGRLRVPFWLVPLDLILAAPVLLPLSPEIYSSMAVIAGNGGLIPWQSGVATSIGRFQFALGREVGVSFYGYIRDPDRIILPSADAGGETVVLAAVRSVQMEFPVLEYRPFRSFSLDQMSGLLVQFYASIDIPTSIAVVAPRGSPGPEKRSVWGAGLRVAFNWRHYL